MIYYYSIIYVFCTFKLEIYFLNVEFSMHTNILWLKNIIWLIIIPGQNANAALNFFFYYYYNLYLKILYDKYSNINF